VEKQGWAVEFLALPHPVAWVAASVLILTHPYLSACLLPSVWSQGSCSGPKGQAEFAVGRAKKD
jgi:hypothetical protein